MNIPFHSLHLITYELLQDRLNYDRAYDPLSHVISGAGAGALAAALTTPLDVCKTLLNTQECCLAQTGGPTCALPRNPTVTTTNKVLATEAATGLISAIRVIYVQGGLMAFFSGLSPRVLYQMPSTAVAWSCYEFFVSSFSFFITMVNDTFVCYFSSRNISLLANHRYSDSSFQTIDIQTMILSMRVRPIIKAKKTNTCSVFAYSRLSPAFTPSVGELGCI